MQPKLHRHSIHLRKGDMKKIQDFLISTGRKSSASDVIRTLISQYVDTVADPKINPAVAEKVAKEISL
jgi:hypothetical protein